MGRWVYNYEETESESDVSMGLITGSNVQSIVHKLHKVPRVVYVFRDRLYISITQGCEQMSSNYNLFAHTKADINTTKDAHAVESIQIRVVQMNNGLSI